MVICLERVADLHMSQLMPLPLTVSCFSKIQIGFTFLVPAYLGSPGKRAVKRVCVFPWGGEGGSDCRDVGMETMQFTGSLKSQKQSFHMLEHLQHFQSHCVILLQPFVQHSLSTVPRHNTASHETQAEIHSIHREPQYQSMACGC